MRTITLCLLAVLTASLHAEGIKEQGIIESATHDCKVYSGQAKAIQMIRSEFKTITIDEIVQTLDNMIRKEFEEGYKQQPIFLRQVRAIAKWVFYYYEPDFDPKLVGTTYNTKCKEKSYARISKLFPNITGGKQHQKKEAAKSWATPQEEQFY